jgi:hypothetical protein
LQEKRKEVMIIKTFTIISGMLLFENCFNLECLKKLYNLKIADLTISALSKNHYHLNH